jgi:hypothetical protein
VRAGSGIRVEYAGSIRTSWPGMAHKQSQRGPFVGREDEVDLSPYQLPTLSGPLPPARVGLGFPPGYSAAAFTPDGKVLCIGGARGTTWLIDMQTRQSIGECLFPQAQDWGIHKVAFSSDALLAVVSANPPGAYLLDINTDRMQMRARHRANRDLSTEERRRYLGTPSP